jgi:hypothetical protein
MRRADELRASILCVVLRLLRRQAYLKHSEHHLRLVERFDDPAREGDDERGARKQVARGEGISDPNVPCARSFVVQHPSQSAHTYAHARVYVLIETARTGAHDGDDTLCASDEHSDEAHTRRAKRGSSSAPTHRVASSAHECVPLQFLLVLCSHAVRVRPASLSVAPLAVLPALFVPFVHDVMR